MVKTHNYRITCVSTALSMLTHMQGHEGNEQVIMREPVATDDGVRWVPVLTGNSLRHRMLRAPLARHLVDAWGLREELSVAQVNFLFHGGALYQKGGRLDLATQKRVFQLLPMIRLLGGSLPAEILPGACNADRGVMLCRENAARAEMLLPEGWLDGYTLRLAGEFIQPWQYTRGDRKRSAPDVEPCDDDGKSDTQMIFAGQAVMAGAMFIHGFSLLHVEPVVLGACCFALQQFAEGDATLGGQACRGHGKIRLQCVLPDEWETARDEYIRHVEKHRDEGRELLTELFAKPTKK